MDFYIKILIPPFTTHFMGNLHPSFHFIVKSPLSRLWFFTPVSPFDTPVFSHFSGTKLIFFYALTRSHSFILILPCSSSSFTCSRSSGAWATRRPSRSFGSSTRCCSRPSRWPASPRGPRCSAGPSSQIGSAWAGERRHIWVIYRMSLQSFLSMTCLSSKALLLSWS